MSAGNGNGYYRELAGALLTAGMCVVPATAKKHPVVSADPAFNKWQRYQSMLPVVDELDEWFSKKPYGIGFVCGVISGGLEVLDLDAKHDPTQTLNARAEKAIREFAPGLWERLVIETTPSGGLHLYFRCALPATNLKLAYCLNEKGERRAVAETRGEGGFIMSAPSPGYVLVQGLLTAIPLISDDDRSALFAAARSLDTAPLPVAPEKPAVNTHARTGFPPSDNRPGDDYNASDQFMDELLRPAGWTTNDVKHWTRPGKTIAEGNSANWDTMSELPRHFHCFTPNAHPLVDGQTYTPFMLYAVLKCGGDTSQAARELGARGFGAPAKTRQRPPDMDPDVQAAIDAANEGMNGVGIDHEQLDRIKQGSARHNAATEEPIKDAGAKVPTGHGTTLAPWPEPISAAALCANPPQTPDELIAGLLYAPGTMLLSGPSKAHKTFTLLDQAIALASGGLWLGRQCRKTPSLYLNLELQDFAIADRIAKICSARGIPIPPDLHIWNLRGIRVTADELQKRLSAKITQCGVKAVVIDPHYKISSVSGFEESSNDDQGNLLSILECLCHNCGAALILSHHFAKGDASAKNAQDRASGAGAFTRWPDAFVTFTPHEEDTGMTIDFFLRNFAPIEHFVAVWEYPRWQLDPSLDPEKLKRSANRGSFTEKHTTADLLLKLGNQLLTASEWEKASGMSKTTFHRKRRELLDAGRVIFEANCYKRVIT